MRGIQPELFVKFIKFAKYLLILPAFIISFVCNKTYAADGVGGVLQQLEKTDKLHEFKNEQAPVISNEKKQPTKEVQLVGKKFLVKKIRLEGNLLIGANELLDDVSINDSLSGMTWMVKTHNKWFSI